MEGCSNMSPWSNIYEQEGHLFMDPIIQELPMMSPLLADQMIISSKNMMIQSQPMDASRGATSSIDQSFECLLSAGTNSNTADTASVEQDDGISMLFSSDNCEKMWNFSTNPRKRSSNEIQTTQQDQEKHHCQFKITENYSANPPKGSNKRQKLFKNPATHTDRSRVKISSANISFQQGSSSNSSIEEPDAEAIQQMKEMIYRAAAFRPVNLGVDEVVERPKRKNVRISSDPQTAAARQRRERISERLRVLQKIVPGGCKMDTASMLDEAANYLKFLRNQVNALESLGNKLNHNYHYNYNHNNPTNTNTSNSINLQFSSIPIFPMQYSPQFSLENPN